MKVNRRDFLNAAGTGLTLAGLSAASLRASAAGQGTTKIGMCDWNLGPSCDPTQIPRAKEAHLNGIQVSVGTSPDSIPLRDPGVRKQYSEMCKVNEIQVNSVAAGSILNQIPLKSEPQSAVYVIDALEAAAALGAKNILMAFFGNGDLRVSYGDDKYKNLSSGTFASYELDEKGVTRVVEVVRQIVPRAEDAGVVLGLENTLTADQNLEIIDRIGSDIVQVYYDVGNSTHYGYDVPAEIRKLGSARICEIHLKDWGTPLLESGEGEVDFMAAALACKEIGFDKWFVLESSGRKGKFLEDTQANAAFARKHFELG